MKSKPLLFRVYEIAGEPGREVVLAIEPPRPALGDWACRVHVEGIADVSEDVTGVDPLQALQLAILRARHLLDASGLTLSWMGSAPGDVGIPLSVPTGHGFEIQRRMERRMLRESKRFDEAVAAFLKEKERVRTARERRRK